MRLIETTSLELEGPFYGSDRPRYAILSHTWGDEELSLQDISDKSKHWGDRKGYRKIESCCARAKRDGYKYVWVDTVCIDKTSSAELSEAINSMYVWYSKAAVCYAYLEDVSSTGASSSLTADLEACRWLTRGWTLQELIAPRDVLFFNKDWENIGDKTILAQIISEITGIDRDTLQRTQIWNNSIATRMSWASERKTTREEDLAYCLLGIFGVNMPMLYGEGHDKAFLRLQQEILQKSNDQSIFAWGGSYHGQSGLGLLASSPMWFNRHRKVVPVRAPHDTPGWTITSRGILLNALLNASCDRILLRCRLAGSPGLCSLPVQRLPARSNHYARVGDIEEALPRDISKKNLKETTIFVPHDITDSPFYLENLIDYLYIARLPPSTSGYVLDGSFPPEHWDKDASTLRKSPYLERDSGTILRFNHKAREQSSFIVVLTRVSGPSRDGNHWIAMDDLAQVFNVQSEYQSCADFWIENHHKWSQDGGYDNIAATAKQTRRRGVECWELDDGTFVHISISRKLKPVLGFEGCIRFVAGRSWESDILPLANWDNMTDWM